MPQLNKGQQLKLYNNVVKAVSQSDDQKVFWPSRHLPVIIATRRDQAKISAGFGFMVQIEWVGQASIPGRGVRLVGYQDSFVTYPSSEGPSLRPALNLSKET